MATLCPCVGASLIFIVSVFTFLGGSFPFIGAVLPVGEFCGGPAEGEGVGASRRKSVITGS